VSGSGGPGNEKEVASMRDSRGKAKQFSTVNGRTIVIKDAFVYSNKGFRNLNQAQLLYDSLYYNDGIEAQQWLIYWISKPLMGIQEAVERAIATLPFTVPATLKPPQTAGDAGEGPLSPMHHKKDVKTFSDLLNSFPLIARQIHTGMDKVLKDFNKDAGRPLPAQSPPIVRATSSNSTSSALSSSREGRSSHRKRRKGHSKSSSISSINSIKSIYADEEEDHMRRVLETAVTTAIDLFQQVDKQQLSLLGATSELTGPVVERLIERHVVEQVHDAVLFPRLCDIHEAADVELDAGIAKMFYIDVGQVGIEIDGGYGGKQQLTKRINLAIEEFRKLGVASSPQQMMDTLLATQKIVSTITDPSPNGDPRSPGLKRADMTMNADTLVSLLLVIVIRSNVRHLQARLAYMRSFIFIDDVESGEVGYALSTFEAVLSYLTTDSGKLRIASRRNKRLWAATKRGNLSEIRTMLEPENDTISDESDSLLSDPDDKGPGISQVNGMDGIEPQSHGTDQTMPSHRLSQASTDIDSRPSSSGLSHIFPFQNKPEEGVANGMFKLVKRVSWSRRSLSNASEFSFGSRTSTIASGETVIEGDNSIEKLCETQDHNGNSLLMMAIQARQAEALDYLLSLEEFFTPGMILDDCDGDGTTLLSAAIQSAEPALIEIIVEYILHLRDPVKLREYIRKEDTRGRSFAHYLFQAPEVMARFGPLLPWRKKDKNGQTPLLALCRSYDHPHYPHMVNEALQLASNEQGDQQPLHADNHVDGKGNTLLHVASDALVVLRMLQHCDIDPNAQNDKKFTPLMVASKFARFDTVRALFLDKRVDYMAREHRGMTAVELAKDDEVRNKIDDMVLVSNIPTPDGKVSAVVRAFFVDDASVKLVIKSASRHGDGMISITTCRRSMTDFEHLAKYLAMEHPASWIPAVSDFRSPYQIPSRPSRSVLQDTHVRLDKFLRTLLEHPTFANHELIWEFILVPEIQHETWAERSAKKAELRKENVLDEYEPMTDFSAVETFVAHAKDSLRGINAAMKGLIRRVTTSRNASLGMCRCLFLPHSLLTRHRSPHSLHPDRLAHVLPRLSPPFACPCRYPLRGNPPPTRV